MLTPKVLERHSLEPPGSKVLERHTTVHPGTEERESWADTSEKSSSCLLDCPVPSQDDEWTGVMSVSGADRLACENSDPEDTEISDKENLSPMNKKFTLNPMTTDHIRKVTDNKGAISPGFYDTCTPPVCVTR